MHTHVLSHTAITCPQSPILQHANRSTNLAVYGTIVNYQCNKGYRTANDSVQQTIVCLENGTWNATVADCQSS